MDTIKDFMSGQWVVCDKCCRSPRHCSDQTTVGSCAHLAHTKAKLAAAGEQSDVDHAEYHYRTLDKHEPVLKAPQSVALPPDNNPKARIGALKAPLHLVPPSAEVYLAGALHDGAQKYGAFNWREEAISVTTYVGAIRRHLGAFLDGEDLASDSGIHHVAHIMACCALLLDAKDIGKLNDDRPPKGGQPKLLDEYHKAKEMKR